MVIYGDITDSIGNTPLVKLKRLTRDLNATVALKLESMNPWAPSKIVSAYR